MKKSIVLFTVVLLIISCKAANSSSSFLSNIKYNQAVITYDNGKEKKGYAEMVDMFYTKVKFKSTESGETEILEDSNMKKINYIDKDGNHYLAERLYYNKDKGDKGIKKGDKIWFYTNYSNGIKIVSSSNASTFKYNAGNGTSTGDGGSTSVFIGKGNEDGVFYVFDLSNQMSINVGLDKSVRANCELLFKDCPKFIEAVNKENFKKQTMVNRLIELYETNGCNKPAKVTTPKKNYF